MKKAKKQYGLVLRKERNYTQKEIEILKTVVERGAQSFYRWAREGEIKFV